MNKKNYWSLFVNQDKIMQWKKLLLLLPNLIFFSLASQPPSKKDSLLQKINASKEDTSKVWACYIYGETLENDLPDSAAFYYKKAKALAEKIAFKRGIAAFGSHYIVILNNRGQFREALNVAKEALQLYQQEGDKKELAIANLNVGSEWQYLSDFSQAADYYLAAKKAAEEINDKRLQRISNNNLASIFIDLQDFEKGKQYAERSLAIARELKDDYAISSSTYNIATASVHLKQYDKALALYKEIEAIGKKTGDDILLLDGWLGSADALNAVNKIKEAENFYQQVIHLSKEKNTPEYEMYACMGMADLLLKNNRFDEAAKFIDTGILIAKKQESTLELKDLYLKAANLNEKKGDAVKALEYRKQFEVLNDSIIGEKSRTTVTSLEAKYESEKKEAIIRQLEAENKVHELTIKQKDIFNYTLLGGTVILLLVIFLSYRNYKQKQVLQQQRINELETEKKLAATESVLKGEEQERSRLAKDLHDGLGGLLSGIKYSFQSMKGNLIMTPENAQAFERSMDMLDSSIKEMRRVAHNLMPEALVKFGLDTALKDFCNDINQSGALQISYQSIGLEGATIDQTTAIGVYRIVQELINNTLKHAAANTAIVQISKSENRVSITVEDDGKGFDPTLLQRSAGIGWSNIRHRVDLLKGKLDVNSQADKGTSVLIEFLM